MLTGPVTILCWSFVRDDISREQVANQIALAISDEVVDLIDNGIAIIQIDEPAIREGIPVKQSQWQSYLDWATASFCLSAAKALKHRPQRKFIATCVIPNLTIYCQPLSPLMPTF